jgi:hypothetical protein
MVEDGIIHYLSLYERESFVRSTICRDWSLYVILRK